jgi:putative transposase
MLSEQDFAAWARRMGLSEEALSVVARVRCSNPARRVGGGRSNIAGRYPSRKMGVTIQFESHRVELPTVYELGHDTRFWSFGTSPIPSGWTMKVPMDGIWAYSILPTIS